MAIIEPPAQEIRHPGKSKKYSPSLRLWHWANLVVISGSLITVLLNSTIFDNNFNAKLIQGSLSKNGVSANDEQAYQVAHTLSDKIWDIHVYFGYALAALLLFRLILEFLQVADQKFIRNLNAAYQQYFNIKKQRETALHELTVKLIYLFFYLLLVIMVVTGLLLAFKHELNIQKSISHSIKEVHGFCMCLILAFIVVHLAGVFLAERKDGKGIVSDMINGG